MERYGADERAESECGAESDSVLNTPAHVQNFPVFLSHYFDVRRPRCIPGHSGRSNQLFFQVRESVGNAKRHSNTISFADSDSNVRSHTIRLITI